MKILITGAGGQLAREFARLLSKREKNFLSLSKEKLDITHFKEVREAVKGYKPDFVINCSAYNLVDQAEKDWKKAFLINGVGTKNLLISCMDTGAVMIHFSTDYVFDGRKRESYTIADIPNPVNKYGMSKLLGEEFILHGGYFNYYLIRVSWVFGDGKNSFVMKLLHWMKGNRHLRIVEDQISSPTYTEDIAKTVLDLIKTERFGLYHITNADYCSRYEWAKFISENIKWDGDILPGKIEEFLSPAKRPRFTVLDNFPLEEIVGYSLPDWKDATNRFLKKIGGLL